MEIINEKLVIDHFVIGNEDRIIEICEKALKWDELQSQTKGDLHDIQT